MSLFNKKPEKLFIIISNSHAYVYLAYWIAQIEEIMIPYHHL